MPELDHNAKAILKVHDEHAKKDREWKSIASQLMGALADNIDRVKHDVEVFVHSATDKHVTITDTDLDNAIGALSSHIFSMPVIQPPHLLDTPPTSSEDEINDENDDESTEESDELPTSEVDKADNPAAPATEPPTEASTQPNAQSKNAPDPAAKAEKPTT